MQICNPSDNLALTRLRLEHLPGLCADPALYKFALLTATTTATGYVLAGLTRAESAPRTGFRIPRQ